MSHESDNQLPDIKEQGKNLVKFTFEVVKDAVSLSKPLFVDKDIQEERLQKCNTGIMRRNKRGVNCVVVS